MRYLILIILFLAGCTTSYKGPISDHFDGKKFYYPGEKDKPKHVIADVVNLWIAIFNNPWPRKIPEIEYPLLPDYPKNTTVTFINHSSVLVQTNSTNILIDPIYSKRASPIQFIGPARVRQPGIDLFKLPKIDVVLISHNHYDHLDSFTLKYLNRTFHPLFIVPLGNKHLLNKKRIYNVIEMDWWQTTTLPNAKITFLPAHHSAQRSFHDYNRTLWGSYGIQVDHKKLYFAGDTGYANHFQLIRKKWGKPDFAFIPIGAYEPRSLLKAEHINPEEAVKSYKELGNPTSMAIHWGTFQLSTERLDQPLKDLSIARAMAHVPERKFFAIREGVPFNIQ